MTVKIGKFKIKMNQRRSIYVSTFLVLALLSFYIFNLGFVVANASKVTKLEREISSLGHKVGEMESELIVRQKEINMEMAYSLGFKETEEIKFIPARSVATILGSNAF